MAETKQAGRRPDLTPYLHLAEVCASLAVRHAGSLVRRAGLDWDELVAEARLALVVAWDRWRLDRSPAGEKGFDGYLVQHTRWGLQARLYSLVVKSRRPAGGLVSLDAPANDRRDAEAACHLPDRGPDRVAVADARLDAEWLLARTSPQRAEDVRGVVMEGRTLRDVGAARGVSKEAVRVNVERALADMREGGGE